MRNLKRRVLSPRNNKTRDCEIKYVYPTQDMGGYVTCVKQARPLFLHDRRGRSSSGKPIFTGNTGYSINVLHIIVSQ